MISSARRRAKMTCFGGAFNWLRNKELQELWKVLLKQGVSALPWGAP
jgi:hypothetical protein